jgi:hypothetical protein
VDLFWGIDKTNVVYYDDCIVRLSTSKRGSKMFNTIYTTTGETYDLPADYRLDAITAENILWALATQAREFITETGSEYAWANMFIPKVGGTVFAEIQINEETLDVDYLVGINCDEQAQYPKLTYAQALRELRGYLNSSVIF